MFNSLSGFSLDAKFLLPAKLARLQPVAVVGGAEETRAARPDWMVRRIYFYSCLFLTYLFSRYVRTGTAASPRVLQILRKKIEDRLKLKELLGENSHLYFGPVKPNAGSPYKNQIHQKHKKQKI